MRSTGICLDFGLGRVQIQSDLHKTVADIATLYRHFPLEIPTGFVDIQALITRPVSLRRFVKKQSILILDGADVPFEPFPDDHGFALLEWGINWTIAHRFHIRLLLHAGVVEKNGKALILPALPGSGKSTLTAALANRGYRLLSDEFGAVDVDDGTVTAVLKAVALKNESIDVIRSFAPDAVFGPSFMKTRKGTVAHMAPNASSVEKRAESVTPRFILYPRYVTGSDLTLTPMSPSSSFARLAVNSFNYSILGPIGFTALERVIRGCESYALVSSDLENAVRGLDELFAESAANREADGVANHG